MRTDEALAEAVLRLAKAAGASDAEVYQRATRTLSADARKSSMEAIESSLTFGFCLRVIKDGHAGFSYSNNPSDIESVVKDALSSAGYTEPDEHLVILAPEPPVAGLDTFDPDVEAMTSERALDLACRTEAACMGADPRMTKIRKASASFSSSETRITNSRGLMASYRSTAASASIMAVAEEAAEGQVGWEYALSRRLREVDFEAVGRDAARRALELLGARRMTACKSPVLLDRSVAVDFLGVFASMLSSESVQKGKSLLKGKLGQRVAGQSISIVDDALLPSSPGLRPFDDEGSPARRTVLVREGVLEGYMYNAHTASKEGRRTTGNAVRGGYMSPPTVGPLSLYIEPSSAAPDLFALMGTGLYVTDVMGMHTADAISGDFSVGASGLWIEGGRAAYPVKEAVISGNILGFFNGAEALGRDLRFYGRMGSPSILFGPTDISA